MAAPELSVLLIVESTASVLPAIRAYAAAGEPSLVETVATLAPSAAPTGRLAR